MIGTHYDCALNTLKLHLLDSLVDGPEHFESIEVLSASPYQLFNYIVKQDYGSPSKLLKTRTSDTITVLDSTFKRPDVNTIPSPRTTYFISLLWQGLAVLGSTLISVISLSLRKMENIVVCNQKRFFVPAIIHSFLIIVVK